MENEAELREAVAGGDLAAAALLLAQLIEEDRLDDAEDLALKFRAKTEIGGALAEHRQDFARKLARKFSAIDDSDRAALWAVRVLLDGPDVGAFRILADVAGAWGNPDHARIWGEIADCVEKAQST